MLSYEEFKDAIRQNLISAMGEKYQECRIKEMTVNKCGKAKDGFGVYRKKNKKISVMPTLYFDDMYKNYLKHGDEQREIITAAKAMVHGLKQGKQISRKVDINKKPENVIFQLVNTKEYESLLNDVPHREFLDLSVIYRWAISIDSDGISSSIIDNDMAKHFAMTEEQLFNIAYANTIKQFPPEFHTIEEIIYDMNIRNGCTHEEAQSVAAGIPEDKKLYFLTNGCRKIGASVLMYEDVFSDISKNLMSDLYIYPVSTMEIIVVPANSGVDIFELYEIFTNSPFVSEEEEFLSDNFYYYDRVRNRISCVDKVDKEYAHEY